MRFEFFVPGIARTSGSHKSYGGRITHASDYTKKWMDAVSWFVLKEVGRICLVTGPVKLTLTFFVTRPQGHFGTGRNAGRLKDSAPSYPTKKPDLTKLTRATEDALTKVIWKDDAQVVVQDTRKVFCTEGQGPGVKIIIDELEEEPIYEKVNERKEETLFVK